MELNMLREIGIFLKSSVKIALWRKNLTFGSKYAIQMIHPQWRRKVTHSARQQSTCEFMNVVNFF